MATNVQTEEIFAENVLDFVGSVTQSTASAKKQRKRGKIGEDIVVHRRDGF